MFLIALCLLLKTSCILFMKGALKSYWKNNVCVISVVFKEFIQLSFDKLHCKTLLKINPVVPNCFDLQPLTKMQCSVGASCNVSRLWVVCSQSKEIFPLWTSHMVCFNESSKPKKANHPIFEKSKEKSENCLKIKEHICVSELWFLSF